MLASETGTILIRGARQLLTLRGPREPRRGPGLSDLSIIQDGAVLIRDGVLAEIGTTRRVENLIDARRATDIDATGRVLMPGFVDSHTHLIHTPESAGGASSVHAVSAKRLELKAREHVCGMARHGTTTFECKTGYGEDETGEFKILRALACLNGDPLDAVTTFLAPATGPESREPGEVSAWICGELLPKIRRRKLAQFADLPWHGNGHRSYAVEYLQTARSLGFPIKIHAEGRGAAFAARCAVDFGAVTADHLDEAADEDISLLAASRTIATLLPIAEFHAGRFASPRARKLIDRGAAVALATNFNPHTSPSYSMQAAVALACSCMDLSIAEAITAATINGAHALRCASRTGSLELGKAADLLLLNVSDYRDIPAYLGVNLVHLTMKSGRVIYREGAVLSGTEPAYPYSPG